MSRPAEQQLELEVVQVESPTRSRGPSNGSLRGSPLGSDEPTAVGGGTFVAHAKVNEPDAKSTNIALGGDDSESSSPFLLVEEVALRLRCSRRTIHELTRTNAIPHRRLGGSRRCLFRADELEAWENGSALRVRDLPRGGRIVTPGEPEDAGALPTRRTCP
jgi:excisionase family DNA binding protein